MIEIDFKDLLLNVQLMTTIHMPMEAQEHTLEMLMCNLYHKLLN